MPTPTTVQARFQVRADTAANWTSANPTLLLNEIGIETDTKKLKMGDGTTAWVSLAYFPSIVSGGTVLGNLEIGTTGTLTFEGSTADGFETTLAVVNPTADRTITLPNVTGTVITTGDSGTVTSTMIANGTIVDADVNASAAIAGTKISPDFGSQNVITTGTSTAASFSPTSSTIPTNGLYLGAANQLNFATNATSRITLTTSTLTSTLPFRAASGTAAAPSVSFTSSTGSGFYYTGTTNEIAATTGGVERQRWGANGLHTFNSAAHSGSALSTTAPAKIYSSTGTYTDTATLASGTVTHGPIVALDNPAIAATNTGVTYTNASTLYIDGAPTAGTNVTITNPYALYVNAGQISVPLASAASPAIVFGTDTNTGIYSPGADQVAISTNGTQKLTIDSSGRVGIGTSSPSSLLTVQSGLDSAGSIQIGADSGANTLTNNTAKLATVNMPHYSNTTQNPFRIISGSSDSTHNIVQIGGGTFGANPATKIELYTSGNTTTPTVTPVVTIDNNQRIGVNSLFPDALLTVNGISAFGAGASSTPSISATGDLNTGFWFPAADTIAASTNGTERLRVDVSGRLLVGTSTSRTIASNQSNVQIETAGASRASIATNAASTTGAYLEIAKSRGTTVNSKTVVANGDDLGGINFYGADGTNDVQGAAITAVVDATPGTNDLPTRLIFSTTLDGASSPTEALRITNDRVICYNQPAPASFAAAATLTVADLKTGIIQYTGAAATLTLPTGTLTEGGFSGVYTGMTFEWSLINTGSGLATIGAGTNHTIVGLATCAQNNSARFATRRTAANTFVSYRIG